MRFHSKAVRLTGAVLFVLTHCVYMGIAMFAPATAFDAGEYTEYVGKGRLIQHDKKHKIRHMECTLFPGGRGGGGTLHQLTPDVWDQIGGRCVLFEPGRR